MYPDQKTRDLVTGSGKRSLATYYKMGPGLYSFTCWAPDFRSCGCHSVTSAELAANIAALSDRYHVVGRDD